MNLLFLLLFTFSFGENAQAIFHHQAQNNSHESSTSSIFRKESFMELYAPFEGIENDLISQSIYSEITEACPFCGGSPYNSLLPCSSCGYQRAIGGKTTPIGNGIETIILLAFLYLLSHYFLLRRKKSPS